MSSSAIAGLSALWDNCRNVVSLSICSHLACERKRTVKICKPDTKTLIWAIFARDRDVVTTIDQPTKNSSELATASEKPASTGRKKSGWKGKILLGLFLTVAVVVAILPQILASASVRQQLAASLMQEFDGKVEIGGADLAWWKPAEFSNMTMTDLEGIPLASIESAKVSTPLWRMLWPGSKPLVLTISRPQIVYEIDAYGRTNWEKVFKTLTPDKSQGFRWPDFQHQGQPVNIKVEDGKLILKDHVSERTIETNLIQVELTKSAKFLEGMLSGQTQLITNSEEEIPAGEVKAEFQLAMADQVVVGGEVSGEIKKTPLELIQPWLKTMVPHLHLSAGTTDGTIQSKWTGTFVTGLKLAVDGTLSASDVKTRSSVWLPGSELTGKQLTGKFSLDNTLPTAPGAFDIEWSLTETWIRPLSESERELERQAAQALEGTSTPATPVEEFPPIDPMKLGTLNLQTKGDIDVLKQVLQLNDLSINSELLALGLSGEIREFTTGTPVFDLKGTGRGDVFPFMRLAAPQLTAIATGKRLTPEEFAIRGRIPAAPSKELSEAPAPGASTEFPLSEPAATASDSKNEAAFSTRPAESLPFAAVARWTWDSLDVYGVPSQKGNLWTRFEDQQLRIIPVDLQILAGGQFVGKTFIDFREGKRILNIEEGYVLRNVAFTERMCRSWLMYVAPVFAEATEIEGKFSLFMKHSKIDLDTGLGNPLEGILQIQNTRLGPGPLIREAVAPIQGIAEVGNRREGGLFKEGAKWVELPPQDVAFKKHEGRVYHNQLTFQTGKVSIISQGSVGDDQTLDMVVSIPLSFLAEGRPLGRLLQNQQPLQIRIRGTFAKPEIDASQLANFGKQIGAGAIDGLLQGIMEKRGR